jgi:YbbR domain-containing protein
MKHKGAFTRNLFKDMPAKVICLTAAVVLFFFHRMSTLTERSFTVPIHVSVPTGLAIASQDSRIATIVLRGDKNAIDKIQEEDVVASIDLADRKIPDEFSAPVEVTKRGTAVNVAPLEVQVEPNRVKFTLESLIERRVNVIPDIRGSPAYGYEITGFSVTPQNLVIRGAKSAVQATNGLSTEQVDLTGRTGTFTQKLGVIILNPLLKTVGDATVEFNATIQEATLSKGFEGVEIAAVDLPQGLALKAQPEAGSMEVQGTQLAVEAIRPDQLTLALDCSAIHRPGTYVLHPTPQAPSSVAVSDYDPKDVTVEIVTSER